MYRTDLSRVAKENMHENMLLMMKFDTEACLERMKNGGIERCMNYSCSPNCYIEKWEVQGC